jgi:hypothetical protein
VPRANPVDKPDSVAAEIEECSGNWESTDEEEMSLPALAKYQADAGAAKAADDRRRYKPGHRRHSTRPGVIFPFRGQQFRFADMLTPGYWNRPVYRVQTRMPTWDEFNEMGLDPDWAPIDFHNAEIERNREARLARLAIPGQTQARNDEEDRIEASLKRAFQARTSADVPAGIPENYDEFSDVPSGTIFLKCVKV